MRYPRVKHSFAGRLTAWITITLLVVMLLITGVVSFLVKRGMTVEAEKRYQEAVGRMNERIGRLLSNVEVGVVNNVHDIEETLHEPEGLKIVQEELLERNPDIYGCGVAFVADYYAHKGRLYEPYMKRGENGQMVFKEIGDDSHNYLNEDWFAKPLETGKPYWSQPYYDDAGAEAVVCSYLYPIKNSEGKKVGVIGVDLRLDVLSDMLEKLDDEMDDRHLLWNGYQDIPDKYRTYSFIIGRDGTYITHRDSNRILKSNFYEDALKTLDKGDDDIVTNQKQGKSGHKQMVFEGVECVAYYAPLRSTGWSMVIMVPSKSLYGPGNLLVAILALLTLLTLVGIYLLYHRGIAQMTQPLSHFAFSATEIAKGNFNVPLPAIKTEDEIGMLHDSFEHMQQSLRQYVEDLKVTTASKAAIEHELQLASGIQMSMLPKNFPPFPERQDIDVYGLLIPAKAVGGDLFDFYIRDEKLFFCIGDVAGKGVPAALLMTVTKNLFRAVSSEVTMPGQIITKMNTFMSENNDNAMFVTMFIGVLDLPTGVLYYCNAGHESPILIHQELKRLTVKPNFPVGLMPELVYEEEKVEIAPQTTLFLYTDGLTEAVNSQQEQFGKPGMEATLQQAFTGGLSDPQSLVNSLREAVKTFVGDADQSDDLTLLAISYKNHINHYNY